MQCLGGTSRRKYLTGSSQEQKGVWSSLERSRRGVRPSSQGDLPPAALALHQTPGSLFPGALPTQTRRPTEPTDPGREALATVKLESAPTRVQVLLAWPWPTSQRN